MVRYSADIHLNNNPPTIQPTFTAIIHLRQHWNRQVQGQFGGYLWRLTAILALSRVNLFAAMTIVLA